MPASDTATTLGAALLAGVGVGFYKDYEEAVSLTVKETRRHEPDPKNKAVYDKTFETAHISAVQELCHNYLFNSTSESIHDTEVLNCFIFFSHSSATGHVP